MIEKNQDYIVDIVDMTHEGAGVARIDGFAVFVEGAIVGEKIRIKIVKVLKNFAYGKIEKIIEQSPNRRPATCESYKKCGGCKLQHMSYEATLEFKKNIVKNNLRRIGKVETEVLDTIGLDEPYAYRNKVQFPVGDNGSEVVVGFFAERTHEIVPVTDCSIQSRIANKIIIDMKNIIKKEKISVYNETTKQGLIRHIIIRNSEKTKEVMVIIVTNGEKFDKKDRVIDEITTRNPEIKSIIQNVNMKVTNVILGEKDILLYGKDRITDYIGNLKFEISAHSFFQVNSKQTENLYNKALEYAGLTGKEIVFDLYCGTGTISLFLAQRAKKVYGVEIVKQAVEDAKINAKNNNIQNAEFIYGKSEEIAPELYKQGVKADVVVVDPPRSGCDGKLIDMLNNMKPEKIVYVSCNSATLARDISLFEGYKVEKVQPVDMFPWTYHVENIVLLKLKNA